MKGDMRFHVRHSNLIEDIDDPTADAVGLAAWSWLRMEQWMGVGLTADRVQMLHRIVTAAQQHFPDPHRGEWRTVNVSVGGRTCPPWREVPELMHDWISRWGRPATAAHESGIGPKDANLRAFARQSHIEFEKIHPFADGNGRVGRLLLWWVEERLALHPTLISVETTWFSEADDG